MVLSLLSCLSLIDQTSPSLHVTSEFPPVYIHEQQWTFSFECRDISPCTTYCSVHKIGTAPNFVSCSHRWTATGFENEDMLEFSLQGIDAVGNMAPIISHQWTVGKTRSFLPPFYDVNNIISSVNFILLPCRHCCSQCLVAF